MIRLKRAYDPPSRDDGHRYLVDRLWPRGVAKDRADLTDWLKDLAPSDGLRKWFGHDPERWGEFKRRYELELHARAQRELIGRLAEEARIATVTLVYAARDQEHNNAVVLAEMIEPA
jgi:uncharacterized protein YeaO (DUF488 family)